MMIMDSTAMASAIPVYLHLLRAKDLIDREYARQLDVPTLAREAHASPAHFSRSFRRAFGETPHRYLLRRRIERAKELLRGTELSVTEIGFRSLGSFSSAGCSTRTRHATSTRRSPASRSTRTSAWPTSAGSPSARRVSRTMS
jgi:AraC-like DNA-binding protein